MPVDAWIAAKQMSGGNYSPPESGGEIRPRSGGRGGLFKGASATLFIFAKRSLSISVRFAGIHKEPLRGALNRPPLPPLRGRLPRLTQAGSSNRIHLSSGGHCLTKDASSLSTP